MTTGSRLSKEVTFIEFLGTIKMKPIWWWVVVFTLLVH